MTSRCWGAAKKKISLVCREYGIARLTAQKYVSMAEDEINGMDAPKDYKTRKRTGNDFVNIIYKMMANGYDDEIIYQYLRKSGISTSRNSLYDYIQAISRANFPDRRRMYGMWLMDEKYHDDVIVITSSIAKWLYFYNFQYLRLMFLRPLHTINVGKSLLSIFLKGGVKSC